MAKFYLSYGFCSHFHSFYLSGLKLYMKYFIAQTPKMLIKYTFYMSKWTISRGPAVVQGCAPPSSGLYAHVFYCFWSPKPNQWSCKVAHAQNRVALTSSLKSLLYSYTVVKPLYTCAEYWPRPICLAELTMAKLKVWVCNWIHMLRSQMWSEHFLL